MSLLMKALEQAAKNRQEATGAAPATGPGELALEPVAPKPAPQPKPAAPTTGREQAQAAAVIRAGNASSDGVLALLHNRPLLALGALATLSLTAYGIYVYLQITNPGLFVGQSAQQPVVPITQAPPPPLPPAPLQNNNLTPLMPALPADGAAATASTRPTAAAPATASNAPAASREFAQSAPPASVTPAATSDAIRVTRGGAPPTVNPVLAEAYAALQASQFESAQQLYDQVLKREPRNVDALLGLAAISAHRGRADEATRYYSRILEFEPRHALAQAGLLNATGTADPAAAESHLRQLIAREPSAFLYFTLGNVYAEQTQWAAAQQAYFQAHNLEAANPDYAYNLAVSLEHINQPKLALNFYRRALQLAQSRGNVNFSPSLAQERAAKLEALLH